MEGEGGPTSSSSSQGRQGLCAPATGRPGGAKVLVRRGSARSQAELHGHGPGEPAGAEGQRRRGHFSLLPGSGLRGSLGDGFRPASPLPPCVTDRPRPARSCPGRGWVGRGAASSIATQRPPPTRVPFPPRWRNVSVATAFERGWRGSPHFLGSRAARIPASPSADAPSAQRRRRRPTMDRDGPDAIQREAEVEHGRYLSRRAVAQEQLAQIQEHKDQADLAKLEKRREGERIQRSSQLYQLEIQRDKEKDQEKKVELQRQHHEYVAEKKIFKAEDKQEEDKDDDRIKAYIKGKEMMADLTREKNAETNRMIEKHKDKAFEQLNAQMNEKFKIEDDRLARGAAEVEAEYQIREKEKGMKKKAALESIEENRVTVMNLKEEKKREEKEESEKDRNQWMTENDVYLGMEKAKKQRERDASMEIQQFQLQQMAEKQARKEQEKQADLDYNAQREAAFHQDQGFRR
ncbi:cilia- and flagella- associated protein 210-like [Haemorhous mexicanus]|uniref:cilia- and flagella- associated protein 210-like n=1 Tax=Haemorhous mexicanus TaxID=30427 RepID=UPI0028BDA75B|nr:cilia- and flagella- associated protein 210-like [Haemorhous mexicanus]